MREYMRRGMHGQRKTRQPCRIQEAARQAAAASHLTTAWHDITLLTAAITSPNSKAGCTQIGGIGRWNRSAGTPA